jgi:hypothetical protein
LAHSAVAKRRMGSVGGMDLNMVWKVMYAIDPDNVEYQASTLGM